MDITFSPIEEENPIKECIEFNAKADGNVIDCAITYEALTDHYEAEHSDPLFAFMMARTDIENLVKKILTGNSSSIKELIITTQNVSDNN